MAKDFCDLARLIRSIQRLEGNPEGRPPGIGKMLGYAYSLHDNTFDANWERLN